MEISTNKNPIFRTYRSRTFYAGIWALVIAIHATAVFRTTDLPLGFAFADAAVFGILFALFIVPLWYPVKFNRWESGVWRFSLAAHVALACAVVSLWLLCGYGLCFLFGSGNAGYLQYLKTSLLWKALAGLPLYAVAVLVYFLHVHVEQLNEKAANEMRLTRLLKDAELNMLKSQINPHFLFNSLNSVNSLIIRNPGQAQKMLIALSDYLRYSVLATHRKVSRVDEEMENIERYLSVEQLRFGDKLRCEAEICPSARSAEIPVMLLQPLFENAIKHGVYESLDTVRIAAKISIDGQFLNILISNDCPEAITNVELRMTRGGTGTGLQNMRERLRLLYGTSAAVQTKIEDGVFSVIVKIPL